VGNAQGKTEGNKPQGHTDELWWSYRAAQLVDPWMD